ncbi:MAG: hypothetical protein WD342_20530 [Verrucomicrobiales bacterium]
MRYSFIPADEEWIDDGPDIAGPGWRTVDAETLAEYFGRQVDRVCYEGYSRFAFVTALLAIAAELQWELQYEAGGDGVRQERAGDERSCVGYRVCNTSRFAMPDIAQSELALDHEDHSADPRDWIPVKLLCDELEREMAEKRTHLLQKLTAWMVSLRVFRRVESVRMIDSEARSARDDEYHRALLAFLLGVGELILLDLRRHEQIDPKWIGIGFDDVAAMIKELRSDMMMWHGEMTEARKQTILADVFGIED